MPTLLSFLMFCLASPATEPALGGEACAVVENIVHAGDGSRRVHLRYVDGSYRDMDDVNEPALVLRPTFFFSGGDYRTYGLVKQSMKTDRLLCHPSRRDPKWSKKFVLSDIVYCRAHPRANQPSVK